MYTGKLIEADDIRAEARVEALEEGREEGRVEGRKEGRVEGREEGHIEERLKNARGMLAKGYPDTDVQEITGLSDEELQQLN